jgi:hypothetical protein
MPRIIKQFFSHVVPHVVRPLCVLWNEIIGFLFVVLAAWSAPSLIRNAREFDGSVDSVFRLALSAIFTSLMAGFGIFSFLRARKISKS